MSEKREQKKYIRKNQRPKRIKLFPLDLEYRLGFDKIRTELYDYCSNEVGKFLCRKISFKTDYDQISSDLEIVREMLSLFYVYGQVFPSTYFGDIRESLAAIRPEGTYLSDEKCLALKQLLNSTSEIIHFLDSGFGKLYDSEKERINLDQVKSLASELTALPIIEKRLEQIFDEDGSIKDSASKGLKEIRREISLLEVSVSKSIASLLTQAQSQGWVEKDQSVTLRDGRYVLPVIPHAKKMVRGIVHDESATGRTLFIEPEVVVETNNRIREKKGEEKREIVKILKEFTSLVRDYLDEIKQNAWIIGVLDLIVAKSKLGFKYQASVPLTIKPFPFIDWSVARHPFLERHLKNEGREIVPLDIKLDKKNRILVISGPNAGGKSVCLKTVGLLQYMLQCGLPIPLQETSGVGIFSSIFLDIGDQQSLENDLSTYSSHLSNMKVFLQNSNSRSLLLIDEFGSGTEPVIGGAIAEAILERFVKKRAYGVITTHYTNIKDFCDHTPGTINGAMLFDRQRIEPLFKLSIGQPGSSFAIEISRKIGLPSDILDRASEKVGEDFVMQDQYLQDIMRDKRYWHDKRESIKSKQKSIDIERNLWEEKNRTLKERQKEIIANAEKQALQIIKEANAQVENTIRQIKESQAEKKTTKQSREKLLQTRERLEKKVSRDKKKTDLEKDSIQVGDSVKLQDTNQIGEVLEIGKDKVKVRLGHISMELPMHKVKKSVKKASKVQKTTPQYVRESGSESRLNFKPQLDIRGMRANEALEAVAYYIDDAYKLNVSPVRILHGTGTGALRELVRDFAASSPLVKKFKDEHVDMGGAGITVIEF